MSARPDTPTSRPLSPVSRRAFLLAGPVAASAALLPGCGSSTFDEYADCIYCDAPGQDYQECDSDYCDHFDYADMS